MAPDTARRLFLSAILTSLPACRPSPPPPPPQTGADVGLQASISAPLESSEGAPLTVRLSVSNPRSTRAAVPRPFFGSRFGNVDVAVTQSSGSDPTPLRRIQQHLVVTDFDLLELAGGATAEFDFNLRRYFDFNTTPTGAFEVTARVGLNQPTEARRRFRIAVADRSQLQTLDTPVFAALLQLGLWETTAVPGSVRHEVFVDTTAGWLKYRLVAPGFPGDVRLGPAAGLRELRLAHTRRPVSDRAYDRWFALLSGDDLERAASSGRILYFVDACDYVGVIARFDDGPLRLWTIGRCSPLPELAIEMGDDQGYLDVFASGVELSPTADQILSFFADNGELQVRFDSPAGGVTTLRLNERGPIR